MALTNDAIAQRAAQIFEQTYGSTPANKLKNLSYSNDNSNMFIVDHRFAHETYFGYKKWLADPIVDDHFQLLMHVGSYATPIAVLAKNLHTGNLEYWMDTYRYSNSTQRHQSLFNSAIRYAGQRAFNMGQIPSAPQVYGINTHGEWTLINEPRYSHVYHMDVLRRFSEYLQRLQLPRQHTQTKIRLSRELCDYTAYALNLMNTGIDPERFNAQHQQLHYKTMDALREVHHHTDTLEELFEESRTKGMSYVHGLVALAE